ncbi:HD domain-containing protein [Anaeromyxobacter paludicola]|uniref:HD/PDEase domain-containing protein n=1 Tax=Anaeromyxobacter paludicola TaxID=2918171 RepID=A0ABM7X9Y2_9BACT|nr:HD domain-containing protein [Anaeromyxobacter paludicola]BDG08656.1 hypothetical protein AMPC_17690 [Anaeromyxobacter paludicola]
MALSHRFEGAVALALSLHAEQKRKGTDIPHATHLLSTASLVLQFGGDEEQAIAGLLHDAAEDAGGRSTLDLLREQFGEGVARIVEGCTDAFEVPKPPWRERKKRYLAGLPHKDARTLLVCACDKLDNARAIVVDLRREGPATLQRFAGGLDTLWYYAEITKALGRAGERSNVAHVVSELEVTVREMEALCRS